MLVTDIADLKALPFPFVGAVEQLIAPVEDGEVVDRIVGVERAPLDTVAGGGCAGKPLIALSDRDHVGLEAERRAAPGRTRHAHQRVPRQHHPGGASRGGRFVDHRGLGEPLAGRAQDVAVDQVEVDGARTVRRLVERRRPPTGEVVARGVAAGPVGVDRALLEAGAEGAAREDGQADRGVGSAIALVGELLLELLPFVEARHPHAEAARDEHPIDVEGVPRRSERTEVGLDPRGVAQLRLDELGINDAAGAAQAEQRGVGTAVDLHARRVVAVKHRHGREVVAREVGAGESADAVVVLRLARDLGVDRRAAERGARVIAADTARLGVGRVDQQLDGIGRVHVAHELTRDHGDRIREVLQFRADAGTGQRRRGGVTEILLGSDDEGRKLDDRIPRTGRRRSRRRGSRGRHLGDQGRREQDEADERG